MFEQYFSPNEFCWEANNCAYYADPIVDDWNLKTYNVDEWIKVMYDHV